MTWEYMVIPLRNEIRCDGLDLAGKAGWELVSVVYLPSNDLLAYFKRPIEKPPVMTGAIELTRRAVAHTPTGYS